MEDYKICFSPKVSVPKVEIPDTPIEPAPLADQVDGVQFGDGSTSNDVTGTKALTKDKDKDTSTKNEDLSTSTNTSSSDIKNNTANTTGKSIKRKSVFGGN